MHQVKSEKNGAWRCCDTVVCESGDDRLDSIVRPRAFTHNSSGAGRLLSGTSPPHLNLSPAVPPPRARLSSFRSHYSFCQWLAAYFVARSRFVNLFELLTPLAVNAIRHEIRPPRVHNFLFHLFFSFIIFDFFLFRPSIVWSTHRQLSIAYKERSIIGGRNGVRYEIADSLATSKFGRPWPHPTDIVRKNFRIMAPRDRIFRDSRDAPLGVLAKSWPAPPDGGYFAIKVSSVVRRSNRSLHHDRGNVAFRVSRVLRALAFAIIASTRIKLPDRVVLDDYRHLKSRHVSRTFPFAGFIVNHGRRCQFVFFSTVFKLRCDRSNFCRRADVRISSNR